MHAVIDRVPDYHAKFVFEVPDMVHRPEEMTMRVWGHFEEEIRLGLPVKWNFPLHPDFGALVGGVRGAEVG